MKTRNATREMPASAEHAPTMLDRLRLSGQADELIEAVNQRVRRRKRRRRLVQRAALIVAVFAAAVWSVPYVRDTETIATQPRIRQTLALADGSHVELNAHSRVHVDFRYGRRFLRLEQGEVFLSVAKDAASPFLVDTPAGRVRVTGTEFNVRVVDGTSLEVTLLEGEVRVDREGATTPLEPGQQFTSAPGTPPVVRSLSALDLADATAWRRGQLVLDGLTLAQAVARVAAYHACRIDVSPEIAGLRLGGVCSLEDLPRFFEVLRSTNALAVETDARGVHRVTPR